VGGNFVDEAQQARVRAADPRVGDVFAIAENFVSIFALGPITECTTRYIARKLLSAPLSQAQTASGGGGPSNGANSEVAKGKAVLSVPSIPYKDGCRAKLMQRLRKLDRGTKLSLVRFRVGLGVRPPAGSLTVTVTFRLTFQGDVPTILCKPTNLSMSRLKAGLSTDVVLLMLLVIILTPPLPGSTPLCCQVTLPAYKAKSGLDEPDDGFDYRLDLATLGEVRVLPDLEVREGPVGGR
jgi:hypothetical protein